MRRRIEGYWRSGSVRGKCNDKYAPNHPSIHAVHLRRDRDARSFNRFLKIYSARVFASDVTAVFGVTPERFAALKSDIGPPVRRTLSVLVFVRLFQKYDTFLNIYIYVRFCAI